MHAEIVENARPRGALYHKMPAGIERRRTFRDEEDRDELLDTLESLLPVTGQPCYERLQILEYALALGADGPPPGNDRAVKRGQKITRENNNDLVKSAS